VQTYERSIFVEAKKVDIGQKCWYKGSTYFKVGFFMPKHLPPKWERLWLLVFLKLHTIFIGRKTANCLPQFAVFSLTKYLFLRQQITIKYFDRFAKSVGCRSPPPDSEFSKNSGFGGKECDRSY
jgi:hypothetical protein